MLLDSVCLRIFFNLWIKKSQEVNKTSTAGFTKKILFFQQIDLLYALKFWLLKLWILFQEIHKIWQYESAQEAHQKYVFEF